MSFESFDGGVEEKEINWEHNLSSEGVIGQNISELIEELHTEESQELANEVDNILDAMKLKFSKSESTLDDLKLWILDRREMIDTESEEYEIEKEACNRVFSLVR